MSSERRGLVRYGELKDFEVSNSDQDIRGWDVYTGDKIKIGKVKELIVDTDAMRVKYFEVTPEEKIFSRSSRSEGTMIFPISMAHLEEKKKNVHISAIETRTELLIPIMDGVPVNEQYYRDVAKYNKTDNYYNDKDYEDKNIVSSSENNQQRLVRYKEHKDGSLFSKYSDVTGWDVYSNDNVKIGVVEDIVYDRIAKKIRYIEVNVKDKKKNILLPIGKAFIDEKDDKVYVDIKEHSIYNLPEYRNEVIDRDYEDSLRQAIKHESQITEDSEDEYYNTTDYSQDRFYSRRNRGVWW